MKKSTINKSFYHQNKYCYDNYLCISYTKKIFKVTKLFVGNWDTKSFLCKGNSKQNVTKLIAWIFSVTVKWKILGIPFS